jgi:hypothetical protein
MIRETRLAPRGLGLRGLMGPARLSDHESDKQVQWLELAHAIHRWVTTPTSRRTDRSAPPGNYGPPAHRYAYRRVSPWHTGHSNLCHIKPQASVT